VIWIASMAWRIGLSFIVTPQALANGSAPPLLEILRWLLPSFLGCFAPGALIFLAETRQAAGLSGAWSVYRGLRSRPLPTATAALAVALLLTILTQRGGRWFEIGSTLLAVPAGLGILAVMSEGPRRAMLGRILGPIGLISYGIYLWHAVIRDAIERHAINQLPGAGAGAHAWPFHAGLLVALTVPVALASWLLLERPLLRATTNWDRTRVERRKTSAEAPAAVAG
jgi:peptidoglycan/LPS O-acetylase OafA/YrhL